jgi:hypothetical protein
MATAFSYSGTGLESAIQSGSGGIGTGSSITLEVDAVPSDVSQGDTVKVALGSASDWSGGNGETAYGDIGGAGANGGTNITLTDRGQEGTSAASWSEGDPVRVGVQGRDDVGPSRVITQSQIIKPSSRLAVYDEFDRQDQTLDTTSLPSGQTYQSQSGTPQITDRAFEGGHVLVPYASPTDNENEPYMMEAKMWRGTGPNNSVSIYPFWVDPDNYIEIKVGNGSIDLIVKESGTSTSYSSIGIINQSRTRSGIYTIGGRLVPHRPNFNWWRDRYYTVGQVDLSTSEMDIVKNSTHIGLGEDGGIIESFYVYNRYE